MQGLELPANPPAAALIVSWPQRHRLLLALWTWIPLQLLDTRAKGWLVRHKNGILAVSDQNKALPLLEAQRQGWW
jgi:hypothetical protein